MVTIEFTFIECCVVELNLQRPFKPNARVFELVKSICLWKRIKGKRTSFVEQIYLKVTYGTVIDARNPFKGIHTSRLRRAAIVRLFGIPELLLRDERMQTLTFTSDTFHFRGGPFVAIFHSIKPPPLSLSHCLSVNQVNSLSYTARHLCFAVLLSTRSSFYCHPIPSVGSNFDVCPILRLAHSCLRFTFKTIVATSAPDSM